MKFPITCYDNFYENPDYIREFALSLDYSPESGTFPGVRSKCLSTISEEFHYKSVNKILSMFDDFDAPDVLWKANSYFQKIWSFSQDKDSSLNTGWTHSDYGTVLAAVIYLDPNPIVDSGTSFFKPNKNDDFLLDCKDPNYTPEQIANIRQDVCQSTQSCNIDSIHHFSNMKDYNNSHFHKTMEVKNSYNRMITYDGSEFHAQSSFYSENFRLTQVFFIDELIIPDRMLR